MLTNVVPGKRWNKSVTSHYPYKHPSMTFLEAPSTKKVKCYLENQEQSSSLGGGECVVSKIHSSFIPYRLGIHICRNLTLPLATISHWIKESEENTSYDYSERKIFTKHASGMWLN